MIQEEAMRLLRDTTLSIDHISNLLGYTDIAHFSKQFKRWTGESPLLPGSSDEQSIALARLQPVCRS